MTYADTAALAADQEYRERLAACVFTEALGRPADAFADEIIKGGPTWAASWFGPTVASSPGFGDKYAAGGAAAVTDGDLLSAVQAEWDRLAGLFAPAAP